MSGGGDDWVGDFAGGWPEAPPPTAPPPAVGGGARETVEIIVCPKCRCRDVRCAKRHATHSNWNCDGCFHGWKEGPNVGRIRGLLV